MFLNVRDMQWSRPGIGIFCIHGIAAENAELIIIVELDFDSNIEQNMGFPTIKSDWKSEL